MEPDDRRSVPDDHRLAGDLAVQVLVPTAGDEHLAFPGTVVSLADATLTVAMADGVAALTVAASPHSLLVWGPPDDERCARVRSGRRVDDVHSPTTIELVLEAGAPPG